MLNARTSTPSRIQAQVEIGVCCALMMVFNLMYALLFFGSIEAITHKSTFAKGNAYVPGYTTTSLAHVLYNS